MSFAERFTLSSFFCNETFIDNRERKSLEKANIIFNTVHEIFLKDEKS